MVAPRGRCRPRGGPRFPGPGSGQGHPPYRYGAGGRTIGVMNDHEDRPGADPASPPAGAGPTPGPPPIEPTFPAGAGATRIRPDPPAVPGGPGAPAVPGRLTGSGEEEAAAGPAGSGEPVDEPTVVAARPAAGDVPGPVGPAESGAGEPTGSGGVADGPTAAFGGRAEQPTSVFGDPAGPPGGGFGAGSE